MAYTIELYANNARTTLAGSANNTVTTLVLQSGAGALFPSPNNLIGEYAKATLQDAATGLRNEIVYITARTGDVLTVVRGQDGSTAQTWSAGDTVFEGVTAATLASFVQPSKVQSGQYTFAAGAGSTTAYTASLTPAPAVLSGGMFVSIDTTTVGTNTTTTPTFNLNGLGAYTIVKQGGALRVANMPKIAELQYNATLTQWILLNPDESRGAVPVGTIFPYTGSSSVAPAGYIFDGSVLNRTTYADLFDLWVTSKGYTAQTFTCTIAAPGVFTKTAHGFTTGERLRLFTTGALPTGLNTSADYFVEMIDANTFYLTTSKFGYATRVTTTGTQSGTHTYLQSLYGLGDGSTTFNAPNIADLFIRGLSASGRLIGTARKGSMTIADTSSGVGGDSAMVSIESLGVTLAQQNNQLGFETYSITDYTNLTMMNSVPAATGSAFPGAGGIGFTTSPAIPPHISFPHIIKY
jgi:hypothetical protein